MGHGSQIGCKQVFLEPLARKVETMPLSAAINCDGWFGLLNSVELGALVDKHPTRRNREELVSLNDLQTPVAVHLNLTVIARVPDILSVIACHCLMPL